MSLTFIIIAITSIFSFLAFSNSNMMEKYKFNPYKISRNGEHIRWISHGFLHADMQHLFFNMMTLYFFGKYAEMIFVPSFVFVLFYLVAIAVSSIPDFIKHKNNPYYSSVGASGAVNSVLFAFIIFAPWSMIGVFFIPMPAIVFGVLYLLYSLYMSKQNSDNIGHMAHISGAIFGIIATILRVPSALPDFLQQLSQPRF